MIQRALYRLMAPAGHASLLLVLFIAAMVQILPASAQGLPGQQSTFGQAASETKNPDTDVQQLIEALRNDATRERILQSLESAVEAQDSDSSGPTVEPAGPSLGRRIAEFTGATAEGMAARFGVVLSQLERVPGIVSALTPARLGAMLRSLEDLIILVVATYAAFWLLRAAAKRAYTALDRRSARRGTLRWLLVVAISGILDLFVVVAAWAAGYFITLIVLGTTGSVGLRQTLFLNAFLVVEVAKALLRVFLSPSAPTLRLMPMSSGMAQHLSRGLGLVIAVLGYGQLLFLPIANVTVSIAAGRAVSVLFSLAALVIGIWLVLRNRERVRQHLVNDRSETAPGRQRRILARVWHWPVLVLFGVLAIVILTQPFQALIAILWAGAQVFLALFAGFMLAGWIALGMNRGVVLPSGVTRRLPLLERRLNTLVPKLLTVVRFLISIVVLGFIVHTLGLIDLRGWLESRIGVQMTGAVVSIAFIMLASFMVWLALMSWVDYRLNPEFGKVATARESTLLTLLRNAATIIIIVIALMFSLSELGIDIAPLLASAGVIGLAIGFGAQKLVQDIITGIFIQLENAVNVGDVIRVGATTGTVERLTIRSVSLRDVQGSYHIIPFSSVDMVTNFMRDFSYHLADIGVAYRENVDEARQALVDAYEEMRSDPAQAAFLIGDLEWMGVQALGDSAVILRSRIKTIPGKQWAIGRLFNQHVKKVFDERGIEIPFPHQTLYFGEAKDGAAPAAHVQLADSSSGQSDGKPKSAARKAGATRKSRSAKGRDKSGNAARDQAPADGTR